MSESESESEQSAASSSASSPDPEPITLKQRKPNEKPTKKSSQPAAEHGKNEGTDLHWPYKPPPGAVLADHDADAGEFEWANVEDDNDLELWLIRVPEGVKPKYLENLKIDLPSSTQSAQLGTLNRKHATFDVLSVAGDDDHIGGEEIKELTCLLPRKRKKGKLYQSPKPIAHHLVISAQAVRPTIDPTSERTPDGALIFKNPPRHKYPKELLKHRFLPYGSRAPGDAAYEDVEMVEVDADVVSDAETAQITESKEKKRKGRASDTPKKVKKAKRAA